jgi:molecular chaperone HtpG
MTDTDTAPVSQPFQAEVAELLHLMVHSVYSETDIFLRELISNASDACDKLRYEAISAPELVTDGAPPKIWIKPDKKANTLVVADSGIGMDRQELIDNLGTIARSGTKSFLSRLTEAKDGANLIGQFGVGFYAAFMVAERIVVTSRRAGSDQVWTWSSSGGSGFEIAPASEEDASRVTRGTEIVLHLKKDAAKYLETYEIERIVRAWSDNIQFPIELVPEEGEPRQINSASALWQRSKSELTAEDYKQAYQSIAGAFDEPAMTLHYRGVIDSEDLPLNISREMLQNNPQLAQIRKAVTGRVIGELESLGEKEPEAFAKIWDAFGPLIKEGIWEDYERREKLLALSRFTTTSGEKRSLKQYVEDLKPNQTEVYYLVGDSIERLKSNPKLESATARGIEVLLLTDPVDAFWTSAPLDFGGKPLKSLSQGDVDFSLIPLLDDKAADNKEETAADEAMTIAVIKDALGERVSDVRASQRLTSSASCLVASGEARDRALERLLAQHDKSAIQKPVLEINLKHPLVAAIAEAKDAAKDISFLLLEQAQILDGELPEDPAAFASRLNQLVLRGIKL